MRNPERFKRLSGHDISTAVAEYNSAASWAEALHRDCRSSLVLTVTGSNLGAGLDAISLNANDAEVIGALQVITARRMEAAEAKLRELGFEVLGRISSGPGGGAGSDPEQMPVQRQGEPWAATYVEPTPSAGRLEPGAGDPPN